MQSIDTNRGPQKAACVSEAGHHLGRITAALQHRNAERQALMDGARDYAIFTLSPQGRIQSWHPAAALMKGYSAEEAIGMPFEELFTDADRAAGRPAQQLAVAAATGEYTGEDSHVRKDGSTFDAAVVVTPLRGPQGELWGYLKLTRDISVRKRLEGEREGLLREALAARNVAEQANQVKAEFLSTLSHELRTPLSAILGWAQVLELGTDALTVSHGLAAITRNARAQVDMIEDLLELNRVEQGQVRLDLNRIDLGPVVAAAVEAAQARAAARSIVLRAAIEPDLAAIQGDGVRLKQMVGHLLNNALKFTPADGQIHVTVSQTTAAVQLKVTDDGQGMAADFLPHLFDRFRQQDAGTTRRHGGLGIGLALVRHVVHLHGGSVHAESAGPGLGSTFAVRLPPMVTDGSVSTSFMSHVPDEEASEQAGLPERLDGVKVLVVDDDDDARDITARVLRGAGAEVVTACNVERGLALLHSERPAVLLSDIAMPVADGFDLMRQVRALPAAEGGRVPAAAVTAFTGPEDRARTWAAGFQMHLTKPLSPTVLLGAVKQLARHPMRATMAATLATPAIDAAR